MGYYRYTYAVETEYLMEICLKEAMEAFDTDEVPVGAIVLSPEGEVIAKAHNQTVHKNSAIAHAETLAIEEASRIVGNFRLTGCTLFVSKEPCVMCAGAIIEARLKKVVFGCFDRKRGAFGSVIDVNSLSFNHKIEVQGGLLEEESRALLQKFFQARRGTEAVVTGPTRNRLCAL